MAHRIFKIHLQKVITSSLFFFLFSPFLQAQWVYCIRNLGTFPAVNQPPALIILNISTCSFCYIKPLGTATEQPVDLANWPSGELCVLSSTIGTNPPLNSTFEFYDLPNLVPVNTVTLPGVRLQSLLNFNGTWYATENNTLYSLDPTTFQLTNLGDLPIPPPFGIGFSLRLFENNGQLYAIRTGLSQIWTVNLANPANSMLLHSLIGIVIPYDVITLGGSTYMTGFKNVGDNGVYQYNITTNVVNPNVCLGGAMISNPILYNPDISGSPPYGMVEAPANHPFLSCFCDTYAGIAFIQNGNICGNTVNLTMLAPPVLDNNDLVRYILFSEQNDPEGSTIQTSTTPVFTVNLANIQFGITYFVAAIAGNNVGGTVDFDDPCFSISNIIPIIFWPPPQISLAVGVPQICATECVDITANLDFGTPPFSFSYDVTLGGTSIGGQSFSNLMSSPFEFQLCLPPGVPAGQAVVSVTYLADFHCVCP